MPLTISNTEPREEYAIGSTPTTGPHIITWEFFALTDIRCFVDGQELDYVVSAPGAGEFTVNGTAAVGGGGYSGGTVETGDSLSNATIVLLGDVPIVRDTNFQESGRFPITTLNLQLNKIFAIQKQVSLMAGRALALPEDEAGPLTLPSAADRASLYLACDADGNVIAAAAPEGGNPVSSFMATMLDDADAATARATLELGDAALATIGVDVLAPNGNGSALTGLNIPTEASSAEVLAMSAVAKFVPPDLVKTNPGVLKEHGSFNGTGTVAINYDEGWSGLTDHGTGDYSPLLDNAYASATGYACVAIADRQVGTDHSTEGCQIGSQAVGSFRHKWMNATPTATDQERVLMMFAGAK